MHVMLDIETFSTSEKAAIVSIGAVVFDPDTGILSDEFYRVIDSEDAMQYGETDEDTLAWWDRQDDSLYTKS